MRHNTLVAGLRGSTSLTAKPITGHYPEHTEHKE